MKAIVTGATGFLGKWLVQELLSQEIEVIVLVRNIFKVPEVWKDKVHIVLCPLDKMNTIDISKISDSKADIFFHLAWAGTSGMDRANVSLQLKNVEFTTDAVRLASNVGCKRFVNAGSIMEYEAIQYLTEDGVKPGLGNIYSTAKMTADFMAKTVATDLKVEYINAIISNIFGIGEESARFLNTTLRKLVKNESIPLTHGNQLYDFIYVTDAAKAICLAGFKGKVNNAYYIGNKNQRPLKDFILVMNELIKSESHLEFGSVPYNGALLTYREFDTEKLEIELGLKPLISFEEGIQKTLKWMEIK